ncbi:hypothetical protein BJ138DRAFT_1112247 [Hygrophoropsis aurantiaca]|uniref:Uncharacterized protein n=1 Tax=Hygrophoropsis aurantiaca TaxID=72124 RepID=A0ACB8AHQ3_9AGAM|nr:hypothetical protein BJ138DRAFT_1112247 [Hygrophoropsis aurantiaca]
MSLPTPPGTSHSKDKENRVSGSRVAWSQQNQYFILTSSPKTRVQRAPVPRELPIKSILKPSPQVLLAVPEENQREVTPEPEDPLVNLTYLANPVSQILSSTATLRELIEAYSILAARMRSAVAGSTDADASWPLFQPLRKNAQVFTDVMVRDLGRALAQPTDCAEAVEEDWPPAREEDEEETLCLLPSPKSSPKKKKRGMSAMQVKYARDLSTTSHAAMRLLSVIFTLPAVYKVFSDKQLGDLLTQVLAIPLAEELPTPNARKTCALSIWLLQVQRLPEEVLFPAKDRIAYALRRGLEGELGKEGKKGSACDGLKAIHDLSIYQPSTFIPAFTELLPSILANLLAPTLVLRTQACHALGGFVLGSIAIPQSYIHTRISDAVSVFLTTPPRVTPSPRKTTTSASDPVIIRTLRTTLNAVDPTHCAQGPVWALSVLASFIVLLGPAVCTDVRLTRIVSALLQLSIRNKKSSVRGLTCILWRCSAWSYFRPPLVRSEEEHDEVDEDEIKCARENFWRLLKSVVDMGAGVSTVSALLVDNDDEDRLMKALGLVKAMIKKGGQNCSDGMEIIKLFVSLEQSEEAWNMNKLLPPSLFSAHPGLLTADFNSLAGYVKPIFDECPQISDVRSLTREELSQEWVFNEVVDIWRSGISCLELSNDSAAPAEVLDIWGGLLRANIATLQSNGDDDNTIEFGTRAASILVDILSDVGLDFTSKVASPIRKSSPLKSRALGCIALQSRSNAALKLSVIRDLWTVVRTTFPNNLLHAGGTKLLAYLDQEEADLVWETDSPDDARKEWAYLSAEVLIVCDISELQQFWTRRARSVTKMTFEPGVQSLVWGCFVQKWTEDAEATWEGAALLLGVPFVDSNTWELNNEDFETWNKFLNHTMNKALDYGVDAASVLDHVAEVISQNPCPAFASSTRVADLLLGHLEISDTRQLPSYVFDFVNDTLLSTYPPEPRNKITSIWLIRSLARIVDGCPSVLRMNLLETLQDGMATWISDDYRIFSEDEYTCDILPLYQNCLLSMQELPRSPQILDTFLCLLESPFIGGDYKASLVLESFEEFWDATYAKDREPAVGWPQRIHACLNSKISVLEHCQLGDAITLAIFPSSESDVSHLHPSDLIQAPEEKEYSATETSTEVESSQPSQDEVTPWSPRYSSPASSLDASVSFAASIPVPSTPTNRCSRPSTPHRPHKPATTPESYSSMLLRPPAGTLPLIPSPPSTPRRTPVLSRSGNGESSLSPSKRKKLENKENISPLPILSVMERMAAISPSKLESSSVLGKRRSLGDPHDSSTPKKGRSLSGTFIRSSINFPSLEESDIDTEEERAVESICFSSPYGFPSIPASPASPCQPNVSSRKRKRQRVFLDAVEVPRLQDIDRANRMQRRASTDCPPVPTTPSQNLRRTSSLPQMRESDPDDFPESRRKKAKHWDTSDSGGNVPATMKPFPLSPFRALEEMEIAGSDDSIILAGPIRRKYPTENSSDDDPHIGQVTPRHLISPSVRRARGFDSDPPSDDSTCPSSPSRDIIARRRQRLLSFLEHRPSPLTS